MNKVYRIICFLLFTLVTAFPVHAESGVSVDDAEQVAFEPTKANRLLDKLTISLSTEKNSIKTINRGIEQLEEFSDQAQDCVDDTSAKIKNIDLQIKEILGKEKPTEEKETVEQNKKAIEQPRVDSQYLNQQKQKLIDREAKCRLFMIRAGEVLTAYKGKALSLQQQITFTRGLSIFKRVNMVHSDIQKLDIPKVSSSIFPWGWLATSSFIVFYAMVSFILVYGFRRPLKKFVSRKSLGFGQVLLAFLTLCLFTLWGVGYQFFIEDTDQDLFNHILIELLVIVITMFMVRFVMAIRRIDIGLKWYGFDPGFLSSLIQVIIILSGVKVIGSTILTIFEAGQFLRGFFDSIMMMVALLATVYFANLFYIKHQRFFSSRRQFVIINRTIWLIIFTLIALDITGFYILAVNTSIIFFSMLMVGGLSLVLLKGFTQAYHYLNYAPKSQAYLKRYFGYPPSPPHFELLLLKLIVQITTVVALIYLFSYLIGEASYFIDHILDYVIHGFMIMDYTIKPMNWLVGALSFSIIVIFSRYIARRYSLQTLSDEEEETQVALASILLYIGFSIAVIMGLLIAGFSFTSLAIIAGALSVGIGLGLQSIVNNFFSGLILLIEKPIKAGDRIAIGEVEGYVKKVRVRSTQIETPAKEDIIIPNSDLITQQVTNYMFANKTWRVKCAVGVAYGSDTELVRKVLLDVAQSHSDVVSTRSNQPRVLFMSFGDSSLNFELWCMIRNVNKKYTITSELNFAIDKAFRENNITISFPQRDLHIKSDYRDTPPKGKR